MNEKLIDELVSYSMNNKIIDLGFMKRSIKLIIKDEKLGDYLKKLLVKRYFIKDSFNIPELIKYSNNNLTICSSGIKIYNDIFKLSDESFYDAEKPLFYNLMFMKIILHEIEHINQCKKMNTDDDLESDILKVSLDVGDRLADYKANNQILEILKYNTGQLHAYFESEKALDLINGYTYRMVSNKECPLIEDLKLTGNLDVLEKYNWYSSNEEELCDNIMNEMNTEERLKYGLYINESEMSKVYVKSKKSDTENSD